MLKAPKFWYYNQDSFLSNSLYPLSLVFRLGTKIRNLVSKERKANLPIICVGNIVIGGAGKTPVALKIGNMLKDRKSTRLNSSHVRTSRMPSSA